MFKHILVPTDGSKLSGKAIKHAMQLASALSANVTALHVTPKYRPSSYELELLGVTAKEFESARGENARKCLHEAERLADASGVACDVRQRVSDYPHGEIIETAEKRGCDLILMASHGRRGIASLLLGSETQKVLTHSTIPVMVYR